MSIRFDRPTSFMLRAQGVVLPDVPLISIVMTCFNTSRWLERSVSSVLAQTWKRLELVVVNDGSSDGTAQLLADLSLEDSRVRPFHLKGNLGTYPAKNVGMSISHGQVITFIDSDDTMAPDRIERQLELLRDPQVVATTCNYMRLDVGGRQLLLGGLFERQALVSLMIKREVLSDVGWFDAVRTSADDEFFERIRHVYGRGAHRNVAEALYRALQRDGSLTSDERAAIRLDADSGESMLSAPRRAYVESYRRWYASLVVRGRRPYIPFNVYEPRPFPVPPEVALPSRASHDSSP